MGASKSVLHTCIVVGFVCCGCTAAADRAKQAVRVFPLPYTTLVTLPSVGDATNTRIRQGGFGSDAAPHPLFPNEFYALTDRGPNANYKHGPLGAGKVFPLPHYAPQIGLFKFDHNGQVSLLERIVLKTPTGVPTTGLPNPEHLGGFGEIAYDLHLTPLAKNPSKPYDPVTNPTRVDAFGIDGEGLAALRDGSFWVSDEYGPHIVHYAHDGTEIGRINPFANDKRALWHLPAELALRRPNRGMEGLAITPDEKTLVGIMQSTLYNPNKTVKDLDLVHIVTIDLEDGHIGQYLYRQDKKQNSNSGITALSNDEFLVIERDGKSPLTSADAIKRIYHIRLSDATNLETLPLNADMGDNAGNGVIIKGQTLEQFVKAKGWNALAEYGIRPVTKSLVVDLVKAIAYPHDKLEGLWVIDEHTIGVVNDDDFAITTSPEDGHIAQKYLGQHIDNGTLYVINGLDLHAGGGGS